MIIKLILVCIFKLYVSLNTFYQILISFTYILLINIINIRKILIYLFNKFVYFFFILFMQFYWAITTLIFPITIKFWFRKFIIGYNIYIRNIIGKVHNQFLILQNGKIFIILQYLKWLILSALKFINLWELTRIKISLILVKIFISENAKLFIQFLIFKVLLLHSISFKVDFSFQIIFCNLYWKFGIIFIKFYFAL